MDKYNKIVESFVTGNDISVAPLGAGHINDSYKVIVDGKEYVLQRINHAIFKNVPELQNNILRVTSHIRAKLKEKGVTDIERRVLNFIPAKDGKYYYQDADGNYWRLMDFIKDSKTFDTISPNLAEKAGKAFGEFQNMLADMPGEPLYETIPNFHNMESRLNEFRKSVKKNVAGRLSEVQDLVNEIEKLSFKMCRQERLYREGKLPKRINHCDTKINNILFDAEGKEVLCIVDLDTVMPGFVLSDFGDFVRTAANTGKEDDINLDNVSIDTDIFRAYARGYLHTAIGFLTDMEIVCLLHGVRLLTYMQTVRFLTDYLDGDIYYKIKSPKHNLERALAQFKLLQSITDKYPDLLGILIVECLRENGIKWPEFINKLKEETELMIKDNDL
ncbi:MAG: aminoglycoside phosphotransferase family protein [Prevotellaceae bacterium]|jgi:Ser/Thr protein kinase RdoA (MazF antagonist)|nr:aminoglycoside phosphotransferase family protein [Prevotellaceae bacterium]